MCAEEGINLKDLHVLSRDPDLTRNAKDMAVVVEEIKLKEKELKRVEQEKNLQSFRELQEKFKKEREFLQSNQRVFNLLGLSEEYKSELKSLNAKIF